MPREVTVYADRGSSTIEETSEEAAALQDFIWRIVFLLLGIQHM